MLAKPSKNQMKIFLAGQDSSTTSTTNLKHLCNSQILNVFDDPAQCVHNMCGANTWLLVVVCQLAAC